MKVAYLIFARDKAHLAEYVEKSVRSAFAQTYSPMEIILSDQGSTDGTLELLQRLAAEYTGPNTVRVLQCPETAAVGMAGLNTHLAWLMENVDADVVLLSSCDDYALPERTAKTVEAFERTGADIVGTACWYAAPDEIPTRRSAHNREGWVSVRDTIEARVGGSCAVAWRRSLWDRIQPIPVLAGCDVYVPPLASALGGFWYVNEALHVYLEHADANNMGLEGVLRALPESERPPVDETRHFQTAGAWNWVLRKMESLGIGSQDDRHCVGEMLKAQCQAWIDTRTAMTLAKQPPIAFKY